MNKSSKFCLSTETAAQGLIAAANPRFKANIFHCNWSSGSHVFT